MTEFEALELIAAHDGESYAAILAAARAAGFPDDLQNRERFSQLRDDEYVIGDGLTCLRLSPRGLDRLGQYKKDERKEKQEKRQNIVKNILSILSIFPFSESAPFRAVVNFACVRAPAFLASLWNRVKNRVK